MAFDVTGPESNKKSLGSLGQKKSVFINLISLVFD